MFWPAFWGTLGVLTALAVGPGSIALVLWLIEGWPDWAKRALGTVVAVMIGAVVIAGVLFLLSHGYL
jgi:hypothetical protein